MNRRDFGGLIVACGAGAVLPPVPGMSVDEIVRRVRERTMERVRIGCAENEKWSGIGGVYWPRARSLHYIADARRWDFRAIVTSILSLNFVEPELVADLKICYERSLWPTALRWAVLPSAGPTWFVGSSCRECGAVVEAQLRHVDSARDRTLFMQESHRHV